MLTKVVFRCGVVMLEKPSRKGWETFIALCFSFELVRQTKVYSIEESQ